MKRLLDIVVAAAGMLLLSPVLGLTALAVRVFLGGPVLFSQLRPGMHGKPFTLYKFRTMRDARDAAGKPLSDAECLTRFGHFLRSSSLDELPELWNVLRGDMSLVGPRPLLVEYLPLYSPEQARHHEVRPGITGWAQVNGRNAISWEEKLRLDVWYVDNRSLWLDLKILAHTLKKKVFVREGVGQEGHATAEKFHGSTSSAARGPWTVCSLGGKNGRASQKIPFGPRERNCANGPDYSASASLGRVVCLAEYGS